MKMNHELNTAVSDLLHFFCEDGTSVRDFKICGASRDYGKGKNGTIELLSRYNREPFNVSCPSLQNTKEENFRSFDFGNKLFGKWMSVKATTFDKKGIPSTDCVCVAVHKKRWLYNSDASQHAST